MADRKDIEIGIKTTADTTGIDKTDAGISRLKTRSVDDIQAVTDKVGVAQWGFYDLDAQVSQTGNTIATVNAGPLTNLPQKLGQGADRMKNMGMLANQAGYQITDFAVQVQGGTSAITAFSQQAPQLAGAFAQLGLVSAGLGTAISLGAAAAGIGFQLTATAYKAMKADMKDAEAAAKRYVDQQKFMVQQQQKLDNLTRQEFIAGVYEREADALERQLRAMQRINELRAAQGSAEAARAAADLTIAQNTGGNVTAAKGNVIAVGVENQLAQLEGSLAEATAKAEQAAREADGAVALMNEVAREGDEFSDKYKEVSAAAEKAIVQKEEAQLDLENERQKFEAAKAAIAANTDASLSSLQTEVSNATDAKIQEKNTQILAAMQATVDAQGGQLTADAAGAMDRFRQMISDTIPDSNQMEAINQLVQQFRGSQSAAQAGMVANFDALLVDTKTLASDVARQKGELAALQAQIKSLQLRR
jgi:hypothetical protein